MSQAVASLRSTPAPLPPERGGQNFSAELDHSGTARHVARGLLLLGGVVYAGWHYVHSAIGGATVVDPLWERGGFLLFVMGLLALSFHSRFRKHLVTMGHLVVMVGTAHYFSLVARNHISSQYLVGVFVVLASVNMLFVTSRSIVAYSAFVFSLALLVAMLATESTLQSRIELVAGAMTVQAALSISSWRNAHLAATSAQLERIQKEVYQLRGLLPICMHCNRIRGEGDQWQELQTYIEAHSEAEFTHGLCAQCLEEHHPA